jgi:hypothetical protein
MTTKNAKNNSNITEELFDGVVVRAALVNKRKFYFLSDLVTAYGSRFTKHLTTAPLVARLAVNGNSQNRRLVNVMDFKAAMKAVKAKKAAVKNKPKKVIAEQMELPLCKAAQACTGKTEVKHKERKIEDIQVNDFQTAKSNMMKTDISYWCGNVAAKEAREKGLTKEYIANTNNELRRQAYYALYQEFDRLLASQLNVKVYQLSEHKLGKKYRLEGKYIDTIAKAGYLDLLHKVAQQMFNK